MKTTEQNNRLIAEFMGYKFDIENKCEIIEDFDIVENIQTYEVEGGIRIVEGGYVITRFLPEQMRYHTSWDWLMPVVEKIEDIRIQPDEDEIVSYHRFAVDMPCGQCEIIDTETGKVVAYGDHATKILSTYEAVVQFIEWYNEQKF